MQRPARILAITASAVLGVLGGVATGVLADRQHGVDPLQLGVPMINQSCTGEYLLVTAGGTSESALGPGISRDMDQAHYLDVDRSCPTAWNPQDTRIHGYIAYLGPYDTAGTACSERVTRRGSFVTRLDERRRTGVQCLCWLNPDSMPHLSPGMAVDAETAIYVRALQDLLATMRLMPPDHEFNGFYDPLTVRAVKEVQETVPLPQNGVVDVETWRSTIRQGCRQVTD